MRQLLQLDSSADLDNSTSRALTARFADTWRGLGPEHTVVVRDLHTDPLPHLPSSALHWAPRLRAASESATAEAELLQHKLIDELTSADVVVVGAPMYNWAVPSTLKAWIDYVHVLGVTAPIDGPTRPFAGKPIVFVSSRGNTYAPGTPQEGTDYVEPSLRAVFGASMGMDVTVITAELTLADRVAPLAALAVEGRASLAAAERSVDDLARSLGAAHP